MSFGWEAKIIKVCPCMFLGKINGVKRIKLDLELCDSSHKSQEYIFFYIFSKTANYCEKRTLSASRGL